MPRVKKTVSTEETVSRKRNTRKSKAEATTELVVSSENIQQEPIVETPAAVTGRIGDLVISVPSQVSNQANTEEKDIPSMEAAPLNDIPADVPVVLPLIGKLPETHNPEMGIFFIRPDELTIGDVAENTTRVMDSQGRVYPYGVIPKLPIIELAEGIRIDFNNGARVYIPPTAPDEEYRIKILAKQYKVCLIDSVVKRGVFAQSNKKYYLDYIVEVYKKDATTPFITQTNDLQNKLVMIHMEGGGIGDSIAWFSSVNDFIKKHKCRVIVSIRKEIAEIFKPTYPHIRFIQEDETGHYKPFASYFMGLFFNGDTDMQPLDFRLTGLHKTGAYILGVNPDKIEAPQVDLTAPRIIKEKYVVISAQSTTQCKHWNNPHGWYNVVKYLKEKGYRVLCIDKDAVVGRDGRMNIIPYGSEDFTGALPLQERINIIKDADFFIGLSSGISWLAWCCKVPVVMISGFTEIYNEFYTPYRIINPIACKGCWNDARFTFDHHDFLYCPRNKGTANEFICTAAISPDHVIEVINTIPTFKAGE